MELLKKLFKDEERAIGLSSFRKADEKVYDFRPNFSVDKQIYRTNYEKNFFLLWYFLFTKI